MTERSPYYFGGQSPPPPPPPPPPSNHSSQYGTKAAIAPAGHGSYHFSSTQPYTQNNYTYGYGYGVPGRPNCSSPAAPLAAYQTASTPGLETNEALNPNTGNNNLNHNKRQSTEHPNQSEPKKTSSTCVPVQAIPEGSRNTSKTTTTTANISAAWTCKACQITLESEKAFRSHRKSHVKCSDCSFEGAPKIVKAHYQAKHGKFSKSGFKTISVGVPGCRVQKFKICVGNRPEDIQRWIAERRKRFPRSTVGNTTSKPNNANATDDNTSSTLVGSKSTATSKGKAQEQTAPISGLSSLLEGYGSSDEENSDDGKDEEKLGSEKSSPTAPAPIVQNGRDEGDARTTSTNGDAESGDGVESNDRTIALSPARNATNVCNAVSELQHQEQRAKPSRPCRYYFRNGSCRNGDNCRFSHETTRAQPHCQLSGHHPSRSPKSADGRGRHGTIRKRKRGGQASTDTLLRKLLRNDMERESTLSMQLLKFIVTENFFLGGKIQTQEKDVVGVVVSDDTVQPCSAQR